MMQVVWRSMVLFYGLLCGWLALRYYPLGADALNDCPMSVIWFLPQTLHIRLTALENRGEMTLYMAYYAIDIFSKLLVLLGALNGYLWAIEKPKDRFRLPLRSTFILTAMLMLLYFMNEGLNHMLKSLGQNGLMPSLGLSAMPLYWMVGMIFSAAFTAHYVRLGVHDLMLFTRQVYASPRLLRSHLPQKAWLIFQR